MAALGLLGGSGQHLDDDIARADRRDAPEEPVLPEPRQRVRELAHFAALSLGSGAGTAGTDASSSAGYISQFAGWYIRRSSLGAFGFTHTNPFSYHMAAYFSSTTAPEPRVTAVPDPRINRFNRIRICSPVHVAEIRFREQCVFDHRHVSLSEMREHPHQHVLGVVRDAGADRDTAGRVDAASADAAMLEVQRDATVLLPFLGAGATIRDDGQASVD